MKKKTLSSTYGIVGISPAMLICAEHVAMCPCAKCSRFERCKANGAPISMLGRYLAWLELQALPRIAAELSERTTKPLHMSATQPNNEEIAKGFYCAVRVYRKKDDGQNYLLFRFPLMDELDAPTLRAAIFNEYARKGFKKNGK